MINVIAAKAVAFLEENKMIIKHEDKSMIENTKAMVKRFKNKGIDVVSNGTDNHLVVIDLRKLNITGKQAATWLDRCYIISNKNTIPNDLLSASTTFGLRLGTCACTSRGLNKNDFERITNIIANILLEIKEKEEVSLVLEANTRRVSVNSCR